MNKTLPKFYKVYFTVLIVFFIILACLLAFLYLWVNDYNKGLAETVSQNYFNELFIDKDYKRIVEESKFVPNEFENENDIIDYLTENLTDTNKVTYSSSTSGENNDIKKYTVKSKKNKLATFILKADKKGDYKVNSLEIQPLQESITVKAFDTSKLYINGILVSDKYITSTEMHEYAQYLEGYTIVPQYNVYTIDGFTASPEISITDRNGNEANIVLTDGVYVEEIVYDEQENALCDYLLKAAQTYAKCMQNETGKYNALSYFMKGTDIYKMIEDVITIFAWDHNGSNFEDISISEFTRYDENTISVRISFNHVLKYNGKQDHIEPLDKIYFATNVNGKYLIFAMK